MASPPAQEVATVDHVFAPVVRGDEVIVASSAIGCVGLDAASGAVHWTEPLRATGPFRWGHGGRGGPRCPALRCVSPHPGEPPPGDAIDPAVRQASSQGIQAIAVLDRTTVGGITVAAMRGDTTMRHDRVVVFGQELRVWDIPPPENGQPRAEPMALAASRACAFLFWDGRHAASLCP
jgi:hypothetical protein